MNSKIFLTITYITLFICLVVLMCYIPGLMVGIVLGYFLNKYYDDIKSFFKIDLDDDDDYL